MDQYTYAASFKVDSVIQCAENVISDNLCFMQSVFGSITLDQRSQRDKKAKNAGRRDLW